jgi:hypothetical protein
MDQLTSPDGCYLLTWKEVKLHNNNKFKGVIPNWFLRLEQDYIHSNFRRLITPLMEPHALDISNYKAPKKVISSSLYHPINE